MRINVDEMIDKSGVFWVGKMSRLFTWVVMFDM